ncbi:MAG: putative permease [Cellvibrionaceae bacterium]|jgi:putative permease
MIPIIRNWVNRYFHNEEAVLVLVLLALFFLIIWTMGNDLGPVLVAVIVSFLMQGIVVWLKQRKLPHLFAVILAWLLLLSFTIASMVFLIPVIWKQTERLFAELPAMLIEGKELLLLLPEKYPYYVTEGQIEQLIRHINHELGVFGQAILSFSLANLPLLVVIFLYFILVPVLVFFFLKDSKGILGWVSSLLPEKRPVMSKIWKEMNLQIANYVRGKAIEMLVVASISYICFLLLDLRYAALLSLAVGLSVLIPYIGAVAVAFPILLIGYFQWGFGYDLAVLAIVYLVVQTLDGNILAPLLFSEAVKLHPAVIIIAVLFFGGLWGFWGVFFAIPLATLVKAISNAWPMPNTHKETAISQQETS